MINLNITKQVGKNAYQFTFTGKDFYEVVTESQQLSFNGVRNCGICQKDNLIIKAYETKEDKYQYVKVQCIDCGATLTFGKAKKDGAYFLRKNEQGKFDWQQKAEQTEQKPESKKWTEEE